MKKLFLIVGVSIGLVSCSKMLWQSNYPQANNIYMLSEKQAPDNNYYAVDPVMRISRVEPAGDSVRLYTHIIDTDNSFLGGAASAANRRNWCTLTVNGTNINDYNVREVWENRNVPTVYALVLDHSGSMSTRVTSMQNAVRAFINKKNPQDAICIVKYDSHTKLEVPITTDASLLLSQFPPNGLDGYGGTTAILNGIMTGMETIQPAAYRRKVIISFTDGADNSSTITKEYVTWYAQQNNINLCTIDFNNSPNNDFMPELANNTGGTYTYFSNTNQFNNVFDDIVNKMNHSYVVSYKRQTPGKQTVYLRYCAEPTALEAHADFTTDRPTAKPVRDVPPPVVSPDAASADRPIYTRPSSNYPINTPIRQQPVNNATGPRTPTTDPRNPSSGTTDGKGSTTSPTNPRTPSSGVTTPSKESTTSPTNPRTPSSGVTTPSKESTTSPTNPRTPSSGVTTPSKGDNGTKVVTPSASGPRTPSKGDSGTKVTQPASTTTPVRTSTKGSSTGGSTSTPTNSGSKDTGRGENNQKTPGTNKMNQPRVVRP